MTTSCQDAAYDEDEDEDHELDDEDIDEDEYEDDEPDNQPRAWITVISRSGKASHRTLYEVPLALISPNRQSLKQLQNVKRSEVPREEVVHEGLWLDGQTQEIGYWGNQRARQILPHLQQGWNGWNVRWADDGYGKQCRLSGQQGSPVSDAEALARLVPNMLSVQRFDAGVIIDAIGGSLKSVASKAVGCVIVVLCVPILALGYFMENLQAAGIAIAALVIAAVVAFRLVARRMRRGFESGLQQRNTTNSDRAPVAGPLDPEERRNRLEQLLLTAGLPGLAEIEPLAEKYPSFDQLLEND